MAFPRLEIRWFHLLLITRRPIAGALQVHCDVYRRKRRLARDGKNNMRITLVGSRHFRVTMIQYDSPARRRHRQGRRGRRRRPLPRRPVPPDRGHVQADPKAGGGAGNRRGYRLIVTAHSHAASPRRRWHGKARWHRLSSSLLRGTAASQRSNGPSGKAIRSPAAPSTIWPTAWMPAAIAAQEWVFVKKGETARELWERALAPLGQKLLGEVIDYAKTHQTLPASPRTSNLPPSPRNFGVT